MNVRHSVLADNDVGAYSQGDTGVQTQLIVSHSTITGNAVGLAVAAPSGSNASLVSDSNTLTFAGDTVFQFANSGGTETIFTRGTNTAGYYSQFLTPGHSLTTLDLI